MADNKPLVSIGMPVYNGEKYIRQALDTVLAQDYENFELIISDNASTDETWGICQQYAAGDSRIRLYRNEENLGAAYNLHRVLELSSGEYFMWASHDDLWSPHFISVLIGLLEETPSAILAMCRAEKIDYNNISLHFGPSYLTTTGMTRAERLRYFAQRDTSWLFYGLYRIEIPRAALAILEDKRLHKCAGDVLFLRKCIDSGDLVFSEKVLFLKRQSPPRAQGEANSRSLSKMLGALFWHCYAAFFKCYRLGGLSPREVGLLYWAIIQGLRKLSFYPRARSTLRGVGPNLLRKVTSALIGARAYHRK